MKSNNFQTVLSDSGCLYFSNICVGKCLLYSYRLHLIVPLSQHFLPYSKWFAPASKSPNQLLAIQPLIRRIYIIYMRPVLFFFVWFHCQAHFPLVQQDCLTKMCWVLSRNRSALRQLFLYFQIMNTSRCSCSKISL